jgi:catechol 2,3-dioxygenase-like lactoylglutathione lyase family enzyme
MPPQLNGDIHLVLVVKDAKKSAEWYGQVFGFVTVREGMECTYLDAYGNPATFSCTSLFHFSSSFFLGLAQPQDAVAKTFDWRSAGLQHLGFHVEELSDLEEWARYLDSLGIPHSPFLEEGPGLLIRFYDLDQIPIELFWTNRQRGEEMFTALARSRASAARIQRQRKK